VLDRRDHRLLDFRQQRVGRNVIQVDILHVQSPFSFPVIDVYEPQSAAGGKSGFLQQPSFEMTSKEAHVQGARVPAERGVLPVRRSPPEADGMKRNPPQAENWASYDVISVLL
jgi:hypothetical protein